MGKFMRNATAFSVEVTEGYEYDLDGGFDFEMHALKERARLQIDSVAEEEGS